MSNYTANRPTRPALDQDAIERHIARARTLRSDALNQWFDKLGARLARLVPASAARAAAIGRAHPGGAHPGRAKHA